MARTEKGPGWESAAGFAGPWPQTGDELPEFTTQREQVGRWRMRNWRLGTKLATAVVVPTLGLIVLGVLQIMHGLETTDSLHRHSVWITGASLFAVLVVAIVLAALVARSLRQPLNTLREHALETADSRLPEAVAQILEEPGNCARVNQESRVTPIPVYTTEEIGGVARAFDAVHAQALKLASEQAFVRNNINDLFVNLARRSQTLVQRQLSLIDQLEQDEQDPDQLSSLFELDHLATRMRRNNENLLILGGADLARRMMRPVPLTDVLGAAVSEVEQYRRIVTGEVAEIGLQGRVVNDFVHLLAELLENATSFSSPETEVQVSTSYRRDELLVHISDDGVGIDADQLAEINERLQHPPDLDVAVSRRMGLYVVARLAHRHGIQVELRNDQRAGVIATVRLSGEYLQHQSPTGPITTSRFSGTGGENAGIRRLGEPVAPPLGSSLPGFEPSGLHQAPGGEIGAVDAGEANSFGAENASVAAGEEDDWPHGAPTVSVSAVDADSTSYEANEVSSWSVDLFQSADAFPAEEMRWPTAMEGGGEAIDPADPLGGSWNAHREIDEAPTDRLPIYEAVLSQWFQEAEAEQELAEAPSQPRGWVSSALDEEFPTESAALGAPRGENGQASARSRNRQKSTSDWGFADPGWQAAEALLHTEESATTSAGLPKRVPRTHLVPGSASVFQPDDEEESGNHGGDDASSSRSPGRPRRSPDAVRGRMANFQQGIQRGRHAQADYPDTAPNKDSPGGRTASSSASSFLGNEFPLTTESHSRHEEQE